MDKVLVNEALLDISLAINNRRELSVILDDVVQFIRNVLGFDDGSILLWDSNTKRFSMGQSSTSVESRVPKRVRKKKGASRWIVDRKMTLVVPDVTFDPFTPNKMIAENGIKAYAGVPIINEGRVLGILYALSRTKYEFDESEISVLERLASMVAVAVKNAQFVKTLQELHDFKAGMMRLAVHDLVQPLSLINGFCNIMSEEMAPFTPEQTRRVEIIKRSQARMGELIDGIIKYEKLSTNVDIERVPVQLNEIAKIVLTSLQEMANAKEQEISLVLSDLEPIVMGDQLLIQEAILNLVMNAVKYTPARGSVTLTTTIADEFFIVSVQDTGIGIPPNRLNNIFDPFTRIDSQSPENGSGLGLSLVKMIAERLGGFVHVESELNIGSNFQICFPIELQDVVSDEESSANR